MGKRAAVKIFPQCGKLFSTAWKNRKSFPYCGKIGKKFSIAMDGERWKNRSKSDEQSER
jgi:hypothetical protein